MNIIIITQDEPFYLADNLRYLLKILPKHSTVVGCVLNDVSPFGKKETFLQKIKKTYNVFGLQFFIHYSLKFLNSKINNSKKVDNVLKKNKIPKIVLSKNINHVDSVNEINEYKPDLLVSILGNQIFKKQIYFLHLLKQLAVQIKLKRNFSIKI